LIVGVDVRPYRRELEAFAFYYRAIKLGHGKHRTMTALGQDPGDADVGKDIPIRSPTRDDDAAALNH
jgi:hypothetical protein